MRIAFLGKGGSGKTTLSSTFIAYVAKKQPVLAIDADVNKNLCEALNMPEAPVDLGNHEQAILQHLKGERTDLGDMPMISTTPPALASNFVRPRADDPIISKYSASHDNITLLTVGTYEAEDIGKTCYHGKLAGYEAIMHHMLDTPEDIVVADSTAGADNLGSSLHIAYDLNIFVVEPTLKSTTVYKDFAQKARQKGMNVAVVINKYEEGDDAFIKKQLGDEHIIARLPKSIHIKHLEQGDTDARDAFIEENQEAFAAIYDALVKTPRDWDAYYANLIDTHTAISTSWYDDYYAAPISKQRDLHFSYQKVL